MNTKHALIMAGGTGGHVFPALAVAQALRAQGHRVTWMGTREGLEAKLVPPTGIPEPATLALYGAGLVGLRYMRRRRPA